MEKIEAVRQMLEHFNMHEIGFPEYTLEKTAKNICQLFEPEIGEARKAGIKEVVEWILENSSVQQGQDECGRLSWFVEEELQAQLRKWGIK